MTTPRISPTATLLQNGKVLVAGGQGDYGLLIASAELFNPSTGTFETTGSTNVPRTGHTATLLADGRVRIAGGSDFARAELYDAVTGTFTLTGSMIMPRNSHTATLLRDGRVLIAGGVNWTGISGWVYSAELYDPLTGTFSATGNMHNSGANIASGTLPDGTVLISVPKSIILPPGRLRTPAMQFTTSGTLPH